MATIEAMGGQISGQALTFMLDDLEVYPLPVVSNALARCRQEITLEYGRGLSLKAILDRCGVVSQEKQQEIEAEQAWTSLMACFYQCADCPKEHFDRTRYNRLAAGHPTLEHAVRACGGLARVIQTDPSYHGALRKDFVSAYRNHALTVESNRLLGRDVDDALKKLDKPWPEGE